MKSTRKINKLITFLQLALFKLINNMLTLLLRLFFRKTKQLDLAELSFDDINLVETKNIKISFKELPDEHRFIERLNRLFLGHFCNVHNELADIYELKEYSGIQFIKSILNLYRVHIDVAMMNTRNAIEAAAIANMLQKDPQTVYKWQSLDGKQFYDKYCKSSLLFPNSDNAITPILKQRWLDACNKGSHTNYYVISRKAYRGEKWTKLGYFDLRYEGQLEKEIIWTIETYINILKVFYRTLNQVIDRGLNDELRVLETDWKEYIRTRAK